MCFGACLFRIRGNACEVPYITCVDFRAFWGPKTIGKGSHLSSFKSIHRDLRTWEAEGPY